MRIRQDGEWAEIDLSRESQESRAAVAVAKSLPDFSCDGKAIRFPARYMRVIDHAINFQALETDCEATE